MDNNINRNYQRRDKNKYLSETAGLPDIPDHLQTKAQAELELELRGETIKARLKAMLLRERVQTFLPVFLIMAALGIAFMFPAEEVIQTTNADGTISEIVVESMASKAFDAFITMAALFMNPEKLIGGRD